MELLRWFINRVEMNVAIETVRQHNDIVRGNRWILILSAF